MLLRLGIDGGVLNQPLALDVVEHRIVGIDLDGLVCRGHLRVGVALLEEDDGFIAQVKAALVRIGLGGRIIGRIRLGNLAGARVDFAQAGLGQADDLRARLLGSGLQLDRLLDTTSSASSYFFRPACA